MSIKVANKQCSKIKLLDSAYLVVVVEKVSQDVDQGRGEEFRLANVTHLQNILVFA